MQGGVCIHTGTVPSKTFREAVLHLTGYRHQGFYGKSYQPWRKRIRVPDILARVKRVEADETDIIRDQVQRNGVELVTGTARFLPNPDPGRRPDRVAVMRTGAPPSPSSREEAEADTSLARHLEADQVKTVLSADRFLVACGTRPIRPAHVPFDGKRVFESDQILWGGVREVPRDLIVVGAGVIGMEYASMINVVPGTVVTIVDPRTSVLGFVDGEIVDSLMYQMRLRGARFLLGETVEKVRSGVVGGRVHASLASGKRVAAEALLYCMGRQSNTDALDLHHLAGGQGLAHDRRGLLQAGGF
ncbi:unnamed protein product [Heterosigma akashiwo]